VTGESPDYYELLQISRNASALIVTKAYRLLAALHHPDNKDTGDEDAFRRIVEAHAVLADPIRRAAYDRKCFGITTVSTTHGDVPRHTREDDVLYRDEQELRQLVLHTLYTARRNRPSNPAVPLMVLMELLGSSIDEVQFTLWYLRGKKLVDTLDDGVSITVAGVDHVEMVREHRDGNILPSASRHPMLGGPGLESASTA
jgi:hypothetical protein